MGGVETVAMQSSRLLFSYAAHVMRGVVRKSECDSILLVHVLVAIASMISAFSSLTFRSRW